MYIKSNNISIFNNLNEFFENGDNYSFTYGLEQKKFKERVLVDIDRFQSAEGLKLFKIFIENLQYPYRNDFICYVDKYYKENGNSILDGIALENKSEFLKNNLDISNHNLDYYKILQHYLENKSTNNWGCNPFNLGGNEDIDNIQLAKLLEIIETKITQFTSQENTEISNPSYTNYYGMVLDDEYSYYLRED